MSQLGSGRVDARSAAADAGPPVPSSVLTASGLLSVVGGLTVLLTLFTLVLMRLSTAAQLLTLLRLGVGAGSVYAAVQLRSLVPWARQATLAFSALDGVLNLVALGRSPLPALLGLAVNAAVVWLMFRPDTRAAFPR